MSFRHVLGPSTRLSPWLSILLPISSPNLSYLDLGVLAVTDSISRGCSYSPGSSWASDSVLALEGACSQPVPGSHCSCEVCSRVSALILLLQARHGSPEAGLPRTRLSKEDVSWWLLSWKRRENRGTCVQADAVEGAGGERKGRGGAGKHQLMKANENVVYFGCFREPRNGFKLNFGAIRSLLVNSVTACSFIFHLYI